ncbi:zinc finger protein 583-like isoform X3 [Vespula squamosa]|uniref:Zinc finger protein 583-like isoform X3 n=1 Tax=Vespula squamosa TaxID=30214 RepID=A0ABD2A392_VESSQ
MNFSGNNNIQGTLPQFSELTSRPNSTSNVEFSHNNNSSGALHLQTVQSSIYTTTAGSNQNNKQQLFVNSQNKYPGPLFTWPDSNTLMQLCEKQGIQTINIPNYNQSNASIISVQSNALPVIIPNVYLPSTSQIDTHKEENKTDNETRNSDEQQAVQLVQGSNMAEYIQKLQATTLPLTLQQLIKLQSEQVKKEKMEEEKLEHTQNNILNIPSVSVFRNPQIQNGNNFMNSEHMMITLNPNDFNVHLEANQQDNESNVQVVKVEQQVQTDSPKVEKKMKFRAKTGEIKISVALDGSRVYCCPECNLVFPEKSEIDQHIQAHIQKEIFDKAVEVLTMPKQQEKDQVLLHTFSSFKEQSLKEVTILQQPLVNMNEILPQNTSVILFYERVTNLLKSWSESNSPKKGKEEKKKEKERSINVQ